MKFTLDYGNTDDSETVWSWTILRLGLGLTIRVNCPFNVLMSSIIYMFIQIEARAFHSLFFTWPHAILAKTKVSYAAWSFNCQWLMNWTFSTESLSNIQYRVRTMSGNGSTLSNAETLLFWRLNINFSTVRIPSAWVGVSPNIVLRD